MASMENSFPMDGSAILTDDPSKGTTKAVNVATNKVILLIDLFCIPMAFSQLNIISQVKEILRE